MADKDWRTKAVTKRRFWQTHLKAWGKSGLTQREYCRRNHLIPHRFTYWKRKFKRETTAPLSFVPVPVALGNSVASDADSGLTIFLGDVRIKLDNEFNASTLAKVIATLEGRV